MSPLCFGGCARRVCVRIAVAGIALFAGFTAGASSETYVYDELGRLKTVTYDTGTVVSYGLDAAGNRTLVTTTVSSDSTPPSAPGTPTITSILSTSATANWGAATDNVGVTGYRYRVNAAAWATLGNVLSVNLTSLSPSTNYAFDVQARDVAGNWGNSASASFATQAPGPPLAPTASISSSQINAGINYTVSWTVASGATSYQLYKSTNNGAFSLFYSGTATSRVTNSPVGEYEYYARACNSLGCSGNSNTVFILVCSASTGCQ